MKRAVAVIGAVAASAVVFLMVTAGTAMAACQQYPPTKDCVEGTTDTNNVVKSAGDPTAFTGSNVSVWMVLLAVLIVVGVSALFIARRRAAAARS